MTYILTVQTALREEETTLLTGKSLIHRNKSGFTFIELLLVVVILSVIIGFSVPNFSKTYSNLLLSDTSHNLTYLMRYAQASSIAERANYRLNFASERNRYWLTKKSDSGKDNGFVKIQGRFGRIYDIHDNLKLDCNSDFVNFYPDGRIEKVNIYLSNKNERFYTISTEAQSGYVQEFDYKR